MITVGPAAKYLGVSTHWVYDHLKRKHPHVPHVRLGGAIRFDTGELEKFLDEMSVMTKRRANA